MQKILIFLIIFSTITITSVNATPLPYQDVLDRCNLPKGDEGYIDAMVWQNDTHYIDSITCELERINNEIVCPTTHIAVDGKCQSANYINPLYYFIIIIGAIGIISLIFFIKNKKQS